MVDECRGATSEGRDEFDARNATLGMAETIADVGAGALTDAAEASSGAAVGLPVLSCTSVSGSWSAECIRLMPDALAGCVAIRQEADDDEEEHSRLGEDPGVAAAESRRTGSLGGVGSTVFATLVMVKSV